MSALRCLALAAALALPAAGAAAQSASPSQPEAAAMPAPGAEAMPALRWVSAANGAVPLHALAGGTEDGRTVFICRADAGAADGAARKVGTLRTGGGCEVPMGAEGTATRPRYDVLTGAPWLITWDQAASATSADVVVGGLWQGRPAPLCQVDHFGGVHSGMAVGDRCMVAAGGKTLMADDFRLAVANPGGRYSVRWASQGWVPQGALTAGGDRPGAALCLGQDGAAWWPGTLRDGLCVSPGAPGGTPHAAVTYQTVVGDPARVAWTRFTDGRPPALLPDDTVAIGGQAPDGTAVRVCRALTPDGQWAAGRVTADDRCAVATAGGVTALAEDYDVLLYRQDGAQTAGR